jgi:flagellar biosynthesis/type III secretory pathway chaperone
VEFQPDQQQTWAQVPLWVEQLQALLETEFELLKQRDMLALESLQTDKSALLEQLNQVAQALESLPSKPTIWLDAQASLQACRQAHLRNVTLMQRQLDAVRGALQALQGDATALSVDLYDRMGQVARRSGAWMYRSA